MPTLPHRSGNALALLSMVGVACLAAVPALAQTSSAAPAASREDGSGQGGGRRIALIEVDLRMGR